MNILKKTTGVSILMMMLCFAYTQAKVLQINISQDSATKYEEGKSYNFKVSSKNGEHALAIEYIAGDKKSKLILTAPHGGDLKPEFMHTRTKDFVVTTNDNEVGDTESFSGISDSKTLELTKELANEIKRTTGLRPHIILNHLHRSKLDANRARSLAAQNDENAENAWDVFHKYIEDAKSQVKKNGDGLLLDIHGNAHRPQRTEIGLLLKGKDFIAEDLEKFADKSSVKALVRPGKATLTELIKGKYALGSLLNNNGIVATPSQLMPDPIDARLFPDGRYFNGGYNTARHGSRFSGNISAIQLEFNGDVRMEDKKRTEAVKSISKSITQFMIKYFN